MELYLRVRLACHVDGLSQREAASQFGIARETVKKMLRHSEAPGCRPPPATETPEVGPLHGDHRPYSGRRPNGSPQAASHGEAYIRASSRRTWLLGQGNHRQGLRSRTVRAGPRRFDSGVAAEVGFGGRGKGDRPGHREHDHRIHREKRKIESRKNPRQGLKRRQMPAGAGASGDQPPAAPPTSPPTPALRCCGSGRRRCSRQ